MTAHEPVGESDTGSAAEVLRLVTLCQENWGRWAEVDDQARQEDLRTTHRRYLEQLWLLLQPHLRRVAYQWVRSSIAPDVEALTCNLFSYVMEALPRLRLDPTKNPISYLMTVAWRGCYDEYGRYYDVRRVRRKLDAPDTEGTPLGDTVRFNEELPAQLADSDEDLADRVIDQVTDATVIQATVDFWRTQSIENQQIMESRCMIDPPASFKEIAAALGPGWTEAAARKRYSRMMELTRQHLRARGLL